MFGSGHVEFTTDNVYGILSIFFWTLTTIVSVKYVVLVLRADNHGEGGVLLVPADKVPDVRLKLASAGLPKGSIVGFEYDLVKGG